MQATKIMPSLRAEQPLRKKGRKARGQSLRGLRVLHCGHMLQRSPKQGALGARTTLRFQSRCRQRRLRMDDLPERETTQAAKKSESIKEKQTQWP